MVVAESTPIACAVASTASDSYASTAVACAVASTDSYASAAASPAASDERLAAVAATTSAWDAAQASYADLGGAAMFHLFASESSVHGGPPRCKSAPPLGEDFLCYLRRASSRNPWPQL